MIATLLADAVESLGRSQLTREQYIQLQQAKQNLESLRSAIVYRVLGLGVEVISFTHTGELGAGSALVKASAASKPPQTASAPSDE